MNLALYPNTPATWDFLYLKYAQEHLEGDPTAQFILHNPKVGKYYYIDVERVPAR